MEKLSMCRICLVQNVRMCVVTNKSLQEMYEKLTGVPFVTKDHKPMLACVFCCTKLKQCCQLQRKCVEAEELLAQMLSEDYEQKPLTNRGHLQTVGGFIITPIENINIVDDCQIGCDAIKQELPAVCEEHDDVELQPAHRSKVVDRKNLYNSHPDVEVHRSESDKFLVEIKIEGEEELQLSENLRVRETEKVDPKNLYNSRPDVEVHHSESENQFVVEIKIEGEEEHELSEDLGVMEMEKSPLPVTFNEPETFEAANFIGDDIYRTTDPETADLSNLETAHPSPGCSTNHLNYDGDNHYCLGYIKKENDRKSDSLPANFSAGCTPQANIPLSVISHNNPCLKVYKGNVKKRLVDWADVKRKTLRDLGKEYQSRTGLVIASKKMGPPCNCRKECYNKLNEETRKNIFETFWMLGDREKQWMYVASLVTRMSKGAICTDTASRRKYTLKYKLPVNDGETLNYVDVCKTQFLSTFSVSDRVILRALDKLDKSTGKLMPDQRGRHSRHPVKKTDSNLNQRL